MRRILLESSNVQAIAYEPGSTSFYAQFHNDEWYSYYVGEEAAMELTDIMFAKSQGGAFNVFKHDYPGVKVDRAEMLSLLDG